MRVGATASPARPAQRRRTRGLLAAVAAVVAVVGLAAPAGAWDQAVIEGAWGAEVPAPAFPGGASVAVVDAAATADGAGLWLVAADGSVAPYGSARWMDPVSAPAEGVITAVASSPGADGYWLAAADGRVFAFGGARYAPPDGAVPDPEAGITDLVATATGNGYWLVAGDGRVWAFGDADEAPPASDEPPAGIVALVAAPGRAGYWLASSDGRVFPHGDAGWYGSIDGAAVGSPVVGMAAAPGGEGYWLALADGRVFGFGEAAPFGGGEACGAHGAVALQTRPGGGWWLVRVRPGPPPPAVTEGLHPLDAVAAESDQMRATLDAFGACQRPPAGGPIGRPVGAAPITSPFGWRIHPIHGRRQLHEGVDLARPSGYPVRAAAGGEVVSVADRTGYGTTVVLGHDGGLGTVSAHLSGVAVGEGDRVAPGDVVGWVGSTGYATGPHLHFEVRRGGVAEDPVPWW